MGASLSHIQPIYLRHLHVYLNPWADLFFPNVVRGMANRCIPYSQVRNTRIVHGPYKALYPLRDGPEDEVNLQDVECYGIFLVQIDTRPHPSYSLHFIRALCILHFCFDIETHTSWLHNTLFLSDIRRS